LADKVGPGSMTPTLSLDRVIRLSQQELHSIERCGAAVL